MEATMERPGKTAAVRAQDPERKYLTFLLDREEYGIEILKVREIINITGITVVPQTSDFVEGVINLRGKVIPVIDLRTRFGLPRIAYSDQTCIIVVDVGTMMGIIVDTVRAVYDVSDTDREPPPELGDSSVDTSFLLGMGKVEDGVKILLDIDRVLMSDEFVLGLQSGED